MFTFSETLMTHFGHCALLLSFFSLKGPPNPLGRVRVMASPLQFCTEAAFLPERDSIEFSAKLNSSFSFLLVQDDLFLEATKRRK